LFGCAALLLSPFDLGCVCADAGQRLMLQAAVRVRLCRAQHLALPRARCDASWIDWRACAAVRHPGCAARRIVENIIEGESRRPSVALGRSAPTGRTASTAAGDDAGAGRRKTKARTRRCSRHESLSAHLALPRNGATLPRRQGSVVGWLWSPKLSVTIVPSFVGAVGCCFPALWPAGNILLDTGPDQWFRALSIL